MIIVGLSIIVIGVIVTGVGVLRLLPSATAGLATTVASKASEQISAPSDKVPTVVAPPEQIPQRQLTAYEIELKLRLIDQVLNILSNDMESTVADGPRLQTNAWNAFKAPQRYPNYNQELLHYRDTIKINLEKLDALRDKNSQYQDVVSIATQTYWQPVLSGVEGFLVTYQHLATYLKHDAPNESFERLMKQDRDAFGKAIAIFTEWRNLTRGKLIELRRKMSP